MSVRENLLRLHRWRLQERQDYLAGLESLLDRLRADGLRLRDEIGEHERIAGHPVRDEVPPFLRPLTERERKIERSILEIEAQIGEARATVAAALQEVKHAEIGAGPHPAPAPIRVTRRSRRERPTARPSATMPVNSRLF